MQNVGPHLHTADVQRGGVPALAIHDGVNEAVLELTNVSKKIRLHKVHHGVICRDGGAERDPLVAGIKEHTFDQISILNVHTSKTCISRMLYALPK